MALPLLTPADVGASARDKINAAIVAVNTLSGDVDQLYSSIANKADNSQITDLYKVITTENDKIGANIKSIYSTISVEENAREAGDVAGATARAVGDEREAADRVAGDVAGLVAALGAITAVLYPGVAPHAFSNAAVGAIADLLPLDPAAVIAPILGPAWRIDGAGLVSPRAAILVDPDAIWVLQARFWRAVDVVDPNNNAVDLGIQWLDRDGRDAGTTLLSRATDLMVQDGPRTLTFRVPSLRDAQPAIVLPSSAVSWRPFLRTYGADGATAVAMLGARDATFAGVYAPDVTTLAARLRTVEGQLAAGLPLTASVLPSFKVADLPRAGSRGRKAFALDGRAPDAAGNLEAANAGTGVEVTDNGARWVITGTNQQVQA